MPAMGLFDGMEVFARVMEAGSFTAAAAQLGTTKSTVSEAVRRLEARLGVRLLDRTTRRLAPTEAGQAFYVRCRKALDQAAAARAEARALHEEPAGRLRVAAPDPFARLFMPVIPALLEAYPALQIEVVAGQVPVDLVEAGFDVAIRIAPQAADNLIVRRIGTSRVAIVASPDYLARHPAPQSPAEIVRHRCIGFSPLFWGREWRFETPEGPVAIPIRPALSTNVSESLRDAALAGVGLAALPEWVAADELESGALVRVLHDYRLAESALLAVYPSNRLMAAKVKAFVDAVARHLKAKGL